jgi:hypothetical protein
LAHLLCYTHHAATTPQVSRGVPARRS